MPVSRRALTAALVSACIISGSSLTAPRAADAATAPRLSATLASVPKVNLRTLPYHPPAPKAIRHTYPRMRTKFMVPEPQALAPHSARKSVDPLSVKMFAEHRRAVTAHGAISAPARGIQGPGKPVKKALSVGTGPTAAGKYPWWTFEAHNTFDAMGNALANVANGNLMVASTDMSIPHFGLDLIVGRVYNSLSQYDANGTDGSQPSVFGNGWTTTLDAHIALTNAGDIAIYDGTGTRWDYIANADGGWTPPAGQNAVLWYSASNQEYYWTSKDGMVYQFRSPACSIPSVCGRIHYIYARNNNEYLHYSYGFSTSDYAFANLTSITVTTETGQQLYCFVNAIAGHPLVTQIDKYDTNTQTWQFAAVGYSYDNSGNLISYTGASNNSAGTQPTVGYTYNAGSHQLYQITSPMYGSGHGAYIQFLYQADGTLSEVDNYGEVNPTPADGVSTGPIQSGGTGVFRYNAVQYQYGVSGWTYAVDSEGHQRHYQVNPDGSIATKSVFSGSSWLSSSKVWDSAHNVTAVVDARGARTDFVYDAQNNVVVEAQPAVAVYAAGSHSTTIMRPTIRTVYDVYNNVVAMCGAAWNHAHGSDYGGSNNCAPGAAGVTTFIWQWIETEQNSRLLSMTDPANYHYTWYYDPGSQPGGTDYSLPTEIRGDPVRQDTSPGGGSITPDQKLSYDQYGNLACYNDGVGTTAFAYDGMNRVVEKSDPDDNLAACGRPTGQYQTAMYKSYYTNGQVKSAGTSVTHAAGQDELYTYDLDGNQVTMINYENGNTNVTAYYFDGSDRLVEVVPPHDPSDVLSSAWITRYVYDISGGGVQSEPGIGGSFSAFGKLVKVQEYQSGTFVDLKVAAYDALDRTLATYERVPGRGTSFWRSESTTYDGNAAGRVTSRSDSAGNTETLAYDAVGRVASEQFSSIQTMTPSRTYGYDEEGRTVLTSSGTWGNEWQTYDPYTGRLTATTEPAGGGLTSAGTFAYTYFSNGWSRNTTVTGPVLNGTLHDQWYLANGTSAGKHLYNGTGTLLSTVTVTSTAGGRLLSEADSTAANARAVSLDAWGRPQSVSMPAGTISGITHDVNGNVTGFNAMSAHTVSNTFNARNELTSSVWNKSGVTDKNYPNVKQHGENGQMAHDVYSCDPPTSSNCIWSSNSDYVDLVGGAIISGGTDLGSYFSYDAIGRLQRNSQDFQGTKFSYTGTATKTYDAENRLTSDTYASWSSSTTGVCGRTSTSNAKSGFTLTYAWGSHGHPVQFSDSSLGTTETIHWDGDDIAFTTNSAGQLDDIKFGGLADYTPLDATYQGLTFWDRDLSGSITSSHNATGYGTWTASSPAHNGCIISDSPRASAGFVGPASFGFVAQSAYRYRYNGLLLNFSGDGFTDGFNNTNGARTLTSSNSSWTVPDAYAGVPTAPQTQKSYVYAANNPASNDDPSGFLTAGQQAKLGVYFSQYKWEKGPVVCTVFMIQAYMMALHINLEALVSEDYFGESRGTLIGALSTLEKGYEIHGLRSGRPALDASNLHNYFRRMGELHDWTGNSGMQVGDILFVGPRDVLVDTQFPSTVQVGVDIDHVAVVLEVGKNGEILTIVEGTGREAVKKSWKDFVEAMAKQGLDIPDYARVKNDLAMLIAGAIDAQNFMGDGGWVSPGNENLRYY